jgi:hypothetical protein
MTESRPQEVWVCDRCACGHIRLDHYTPERDGTNAGGGECRHEDCVSFIKGTVGTRCHKFELGAYYNEYTNGYDPIE